MDLEVAGDTLARATGTRVGASDHATEIFVFYMVVSWVCTSILYILRFNCAY